MVTPRESCGRLLLPEGPRPFEDETMCAYCVFHTNIKAKESSLKKLCFCPREMKNVHCCCKFKLSLNISQTKKERKKKEQTKKEQRFRVLLLSSCHAIVSDDEEKWLAEIDSLTSISLKITIFVQS